MFKNLGKELRDFILRGNVMDMAVGIIIGAAFGKIVDSLEVKLIFQTFILQYFRLVKNMILLMPQQKLVL